MKLVLLTDTHAGARGDSLIFNDYFFKFYEEVFFPYLAKNNLYQILHLGDVVDRPKYTTYEIANQWRVRFWDRLRAYDATVDVLVGNHDTPNSRYSNTPNAVEELWSGYSNVRVISECCIRTYGGTPYALIPWINQTNYKDTMNFIEKCRAPVAFSHLELSGFEASKGQVLNHGMDRNLFRGFKMVMSGHYHHRSSDGHIHYLGNPYEITWADYDDPRGFHVFDTDTHELEFILNPYKMHYKVEYFNGTIMGWPTMEGVKCSLKDRIVRVIVKNKDDQESYDKFLKLVQDEEPHKLEIEDYGDEIVNTAVNTDDNVLSTIGVIEQYIDDSDTTLDKDRLKRHMFDLYKAAQ